MRVADDTSMDEMMYLLTEIWGLQQPNLLISVTGGAKNITMSKRLKDTFKRGLLKTAQTTGKTLGLHCRLGQQQIFLQQHITLSTDVEILMSSHR